ncbi:MAG: hypothetical protein HYV09_32080 [Deltaproteobacteria bacterium]|nr:hypothetical protein [Deltaproteobacteria bacterium]
MVQRRRLDDPSAIIDSLVAHGAVLGALVVAILAAVVPSMRGAMPGSLFIAAIAGARLAFHPLRFIALSRVFVDGSRVLVGPMLGRAREVHVARVEHDGHSPWPCVLHLSDGAHARFVARRDDGGLALLDLDPSDRARYERPSDARDSLVELQLTMRRRDAA